MGQIRTISCDKSKCGKTFTEKQYGEGFKGWGSVAGKTKSGQEIFLCPAHLVDVLNFIDPREGFE